MAFALSLAFTLVLAAGVIAGRDRLFAAPASDASPNTPASTVSLGDEDTPAVTTTGAAPRIIEIPLPAPQSDAARSVSADAERSGDDDRYERSRDGEGDDHEEEDDD
jgi:hypothetical protein